MADSGIVLDRSQADILAGILSNRVMEEINSENPEFSQAAQGLIGDQLGSRLDETFAGKESVSIEELQASLNGAVQEANSFGVVDVSKESVTITGDDLTQAGVDPELAQQYGAEALDGYAIPDVVEEKGFFEKLISAFQEGGFMAAITTLFTSIFGGGEEENKEVAVTEANAALDVNQDQTIDAKDLHAMDLDKDGRLQESEIEQAVGDNAELRAELDGVMSELGIKTDGRHIEDGETVQAGVGGSAPGQDGPDSQER